MEDTLLQDLRAVAEYAPKVLLRISNPSGEHFYAGFTRMNDYGLPADARVQLSIAPGGKVAKWLRGDAPNLLFILMNWAASLPLSVRLEHRMDFDESGQTPSYELSLWDVKERVRARARDPLTALLRSIALDNQPDL